MRQRHRKEIGMDDSTGIDLAPMLDFVLNLLIFFIITAVFLKEVGINVSRPNSSAAEKSESSSIVILIAAGIVALRTERDTQSCVRPMPHQGLGHGQRRPTCRSHC